MAGDADEGFGQQAADLRGGELAGRGGEVDAVGCDRERDIGAAGYEDLCGGIGGADCGDDGCGLA